MTTNQHHFYEKEYSQQLQRAYLFLGDVASAQDAVQDAFEQVLRRWHRIENPGGYLHQCVLNACRDRFNQSRRLHLGADYESAAQQIAAPADSRLAELWDVLGELPFNQRAALVLRYFEGRTEAEIGDALGLRPGSVGPLLTRGLRKLRLKIVSP